jgi:hypothetical protein
MNSARGLERAFWESDLFLAKWEVTYCMTEIVEFMQGEESLSYNENRLKNNFTKSNNELIYQFGKLWKPEGFTVVEEEIFWYALSELYDRKILYQYKDSVGRRWINVDPYFMNV